MALEDKLVLSMDGTIFMTTWVDASYVMHDDMRGYICGCITLGAEMIHCKSSKQKLNNKSLTESEVFGTSDYLPFTIWCKYFIEGQAI